MQMCETMTAGKAVEVRLYDGADSEAWDSYVDSHPGATVFHMMAWSRAVRRAYRHEPLHLIAWAGDRIVGILPLFLVKSIFVGRVLVSVPYTTYGGILADSDEVAKLLLAATEEISAEKGAEYLELRHRDPNALGLPEIDRYDTFRRQLPEEPRDILPSVPRKTRAAASKGLKLLDTSFGRDLLDTVYELYACALRRLGSPNYRRRFFRELQNTYGDDCVCLVVRDQGKPVAGVIRYIFRHEIVPYFSGSLD